MSEVIDVANLPVPDPKQLPTGDNVRHTKTIIEELDQSIEHLEQDIKRLHEQLQEVRRKRANYVSYISPLRRLPTEILCNIIGICIEGGVDILTLSEICSRLRQAALGMAGIWSNITLHCVTKYPIFGQKYGSFETVIQQFSFSRARLISR
jgi:hypothetical protein